MTSLSEKSVFYGNNITVVHKDKDCTVYKMEDATGVGTMTRYQVLPGIDLLYNDFHMQSCFSEFWTDTELIAIDHCRVGRIEWELREGTYIYLQEGDLQVDRRKDHIHGYGFPLSHYHGITVAIHIEEAAKTLSSVFDGISIDLEALCSKFHSPRCPFIMRAQDSIHHIFSELYTVPEQIRKDYHKIKVVELLLFLSVVEVPRNGEERPYFPKKQVETVKAIMDHITAHMDKHFTLEALSAAFDIPLTTMKCCFKGIYGISIYAYIRTYRIQTAAYLLSRTDENITAIAGKVGYSNPSKFSAAFKDIYGVSPIQYKKQLV